MGDTKNQTFLATIFCIVPNTERLFPFHATALCAKTLLWERISSLFSWIDNESAWWREANFFLYLWLADAWHRWKRKAKGLSFWRRKEIFSQIPGSVWKGLFRVANSQMKREGSLLLFTPLTGKNLKGDYVFPKSWFSGDVWSSFKSFSTR